MSKANIFVAATGQHVGKTTTTLGLTAAFQNRGINVGYSKPVGQKFLDIQNMRVDKDAVLFADLLGFDLLPEQHSPIILGKGATSKYIENPDSVDLDELILNANSTLHATHELIVYEGTGHPGVGSVADISNADVARLLKAGVIMVVPGGIGNTIDKLNLSLSLFREQNVPIIGVIINKVRIDKIDKVKKFVGIKLKQMNLPFLGAIPYDQILAYPVLRAVVQAVNGSITHFQNEDYNRVENILAGSLVDVNDVKNLKNLLLIVSPRQIDRAVSRIDSLSRIFHLKDCPLSGIVATGAEPLSSTAESYIEKNRIPVIRTHLDTYGSFLKINKIEVKINRGTPWKVARAIQLVEENVNLELIEERCERLAEHGNLN